MLGTDSHICYTIGDFTETDKLLAEVKFPEELILNYDIRNLERLVNPQKRDMNK